MKFHSRNCPSPDGFVPSKFGSKLPSISGVGTVLNRTHSGKVPNKEVKIMTEAWGLLIITETFEYKIPLHFGTKH